MPKKKMILKQYNAETKAVENERSLMVTISTSAVDRSGDIVEPNGGKFVNFIKNPVVLMAHDYSGLPIGKASNLTKTEKGITAKVTFPEEGTYPLADTVYNMYKQKFMRAWSIGFIPTKSEEIKDDEGKKNVTGYRFMNWELLEFSACSVPANPEALTNMVSKGIDVGLLKEEGLIEIVEGEDIEKAEAATEKEEKAKYDCECIDCGYEMTSDKHCKEIKCPECGGTMRRAERPGPGEDSKSEEETFPEKEEEPNKSFSVDEVYEIVEENKELKEKIATLEIKAGAVLNAKNKKYLSDSLTNIQAVLDSAGTTEESIKDVDEIIDDKGDDNEIEIVTDTVDDVLIDEAKVEPTVIELNTFEVDDETINNLINDKLNYALGRVSK